MFQIFTDLASWLVYEQLGLSPQTKLGMRCISSWRM